MTNFTFEWKIYKNLGKLSGSSQVYRVVGTGAIGYN